MTLSDAQLEWIVREVVGRLRAALRADADADADAETPPRLESQTLVLDERVVATETLRQRLGGARRVEVTSKSVVTPAAKDMLRDLGVELVRLD